MDTQDCDKGLNYVLERGSSSWMVTSEKKERKCDYESFNYTFLKKKTSVNMQNVDKLEGQFCKCVSSFFSVGNNLGSGNCNILRWKHDPMASEVRWEVPDYRKDSKVSGERQAGYLEGSKSRASLTWKEDKVGLYWEGEQDRPSVNGKHKVPFKQMLLSWWCVAPEFRIV